MKALAIPAVVAAVSLSATSVQAGGHRYASEVPGMSSMTIDPWTFNGGIARNKRVVVETDFAPGKHRTFGGTKKAYIGWNDPFAGDFNGDGYDDIGVRWTKGVNTSRWTISLNDKKGNFGAGKGVTFGGTVLAYPGQNALVVGDFNRDGYDDIGVHWKAGPHAGRWTISLNDKKGNFKAGKGVTFGGTTRAYVGANEPFVGDFDGDGWDDIGVRWTAGPNRGRWTISLNDRKGNFKAGKGVRFGGDTKAYVGSNQLVVGDFNGDKRADIGVRWTGGSSKFRWTVSLNDGKGNFMPGRSVTFGNVVKAYAGSVRPVVGDYDGDGVDDIGVKWTSGGNNGLWVFSRNARRLRTTRVRKMKVRMPVVFVNYPGMARKTTDAAAADLLDNVRRYLARTTHNNVEVEFKYDVVDLKHGPAWRDGAPMPKYAANGVLQNGDAYPAVRDYRGYACRFPFPGTKGSSQIVFKTSKGSLGWKNNANIHRNYCQVGERNFARDALQAWRTADRTGFDAAMKWASKGSNGPMFAMLSPGLPGGGVRMLRENVTKQWPLSIAGREYRDYIYLDQSPQGFAHELVHALGHGGEMYGNPPGNQCASSDSLGFLADLSLMGWTTDKFPAVNGVNRWRMGFAEARYVTPDERKVTVELDKALTASAFGRSVVVVHPDPKGHRDEAFVIEYRARVKVKARTYDDLPFEGMYVYRVNAKGRSKAKPLIDLLEVKARCPQKLVPMRGTLSPRNDPGLRFTDGSSARFEIKPVKRGDKLRVTITFE